MGEHGVQDGPTWRPEGPRWAQKTRFLAGGSARRVLDAFVAALLSRVGMSTTDVFEVAHKGAFLGPLTLSGALRGAPQAAGESVFGPRLVRF